MINAFDVWMSERLSYDEKEYKRWRAQIDSPPREALRTERAAEETGASFLTFMGQVQGESGVSTG